jgi:hypothetical protein
MNKSTSRAKASLDKQRRGYKAALKGKDFEKKVGAFLSREGYTISYEKPIGKAKFDVFGKKKGDWGFEKYYIAECKDKARITSTDVMHFMAKLKTFYNRLPVDIDGDKPKVQGLLAYTGELPVDARSATKLSTKVPINFKKF